jgi:ABC-type uncharacterized transport system substrate-binding protein
MVGAPLILAALLSAAPQGGGDVVVLKQPGIVAFEEVIEGFTEHCRVRVRTVTIESGPDGPAEAERRVGQAQLVVAVGQTAVEIGKRSGVTVVHALATDPPALSIGAEVSAPPEAVFRALLDLRPAVRRIGVVAGRRGAARLTEARRAAQALELELIERPAETGPQAILALRDLTSAEPPVDALWVGADPQLLVTPVFQYALQLQLQRGLPVVAATRQQVRSGAFLAVDWPPRLVGRRLAALVNLALDGVRHPVLAGKEDPAGLPQATVNGLIARKIGIDIERWKAAGWRIE